MDCDYKCILIVGLIIGGLASIYINNTDLASVIFGGLIGYLSHGVNSSAIGIGESVSGVNSSAISTSDEVIEEDDEGA